MGIVSKIKKALRGGLLRKVGGMIGKSDSRLGKVRVFICKMKLSQINRIAVSTGAVAGQVSVISGGLGSLGEPIKTVAGGLSTAAGSVADAAAQVNGFLTSLDERLFRTGRKLYKQCYRILKLCTDVMSVISKYAKQIRKIVKIIRTALKIIKFILKILGMGPAMTLIVKVEAFLKKLDAALLIVSRSTGQLAAICRDLMDQLMGMDSKYLIEPSDLDGLRSEGRVACLPDRLFPEDEFCDPDWDDEIDNKMVVANDLQLLDDELLNIELELEALFDRRSPQTKNECLRFLADLDCVDKLDAIVGGLGDISTDDSDAQAIIDRARSNIGSARDNIRNSVGNLDFQNVGFAPMDASNAPIIETIAPMKIATDTVVYVKEQNLQRLSVQGNTGVEYNNNKIPEYLDYRKDIDEGNVSKLTGPDFISKYNLGMSMRQAVNDIPTDLLTTPGRIGIKPGGYGLILNE